MTADLGELADGGEERCVPGIADLGSGIDTVHPHLPAVVVGRGVDLDGDAPGQLGDAIEVAGPEACPDRGHDDGAVEEAGVDEREVQGQGQPASKCRLAAPRRPVHGDDAHGHGAVIPTAA